MRLKARSPMTGFRGLVWTSRTGARFQLNPAAGVPGPWYGRRSGEVRVPDRAEHRGRRRRQERRGKPDDPPALLIHADQERPHHVTV